MKWRHTRHCDSRGWSDTTNRGWTAAHSALRVTALAAAESGSECCVRRLAVAGTRDTYTGRQWQWQEWSPWTVRAAYYLCRTVDWLLLYRVGLVSALCTLLHRQAAPGIRAQTQAIYRVKTWLGKLPMSSVCVSSRPCQLFISFALPLSFSAALPAPFLAFLPLPRRVFFFTTPLSSPRVESPPTFWHVHSTQ